MNKKFLARKRCVALLSFTLAIPLMQPSEALAQDAYGSGPGGPSESAAWPPRGYSYPSNSSDEFVDPSAPQPPGYTTGSMAPTLQGTTNGTIVPAEENPVMENIRNITGETVQIHDDEFRRSTQLPDARVLLGESICDLSYRPIACEEVKLPADFPPLPKQITLAREITESQIRHETPPSHPFEFSLPLNLSGKGPLFPTANVHSRQMPLEIMVPAADVQAMSEANYQAACNPDFESMFAAYCMQLQHTGQVPAYLYEEITELRKQDLGAPSAYACMARLKQAIARAKACTASPQQRAKLAEVLERQGKPYDALVHRLRCADILDDGPSKHQLANLYFKLNEKKLAFETLRDSSEKSWDGSQSEELSDVHYLMGKYIHELARDAEKHGNDELRMLRLRNASACLRRAVCLDRHNREALRRLIQVAREATSLDNSFDNQLMLGSANLIAGDLERAGNAYNECSAINKQEPRLKQARQVLDSITRKQAAFDSAAAKSAPQTTGRLASGKKE